MVWAGGRVFPHGVNYLPIVCWEGQSAVGGGAIGWALTDKNEIIQSTCAMRHCGLSAVSIGMHSLILVIDLQRWGFISLFPAHVVAGAGADGWRNVTQMFACTFNHSAAAADAAVSNGSKLYANLGGKHILKLIGQTI